MTLETFSPYVGERFEVRLEPSQTPIGSIVLIEAERYPKANPSTGRPFSLIFKGETGEGQWEQGTYWLRTSESESEPIFLVPVGPGRYQAVFN